MGAPIKPCSIDLIASPSHRVLDPLWAYHKLYSVFATYGDAFLVVSPWGLYLANASPSVIHQIATRRTDWVKPIEHYAVVEQFGPNVVTTEGSTWREHRKITSGSFNEKSNAVVWKESIRQAQQMIKAWARRNSNGADSAMEVGDVYPDAATTSMHIIGRSGFGVKLLWPGEELEERLPLDQPKKVWEGHANLNSYLHELLELKKNAIKDGTAEKDSLDLMVPLIEASNTGTSTKFTTANILGNAFIFLFAGHETTANSITFLLIFLALNLPAQRRLQSTLDTLLAPHSKQTPQEWPYPSLFNTLGNSYLGACINEQLRLIASVTMIPKRSIGPQTLTLEDGRTVRVPGNTFQHFCVPSVHRNPHYWPHKPTSLRDPAAKNDLNDFVPERWLLPTSNPSTAADQGQTDGEEIKESGGKHHKTTIEELESSDGPDIGAAALFNPPRGAFLPFSHGARACLGRRFAMVELVGVLATLMKDYSVELDVRDFAPPPTQTTTASEKKGGAGQGAEEEEDIFEAMMKRLDEGEKRAVYGKAQERAWTILERELGGLVTLQCVGRKVPLRFCRRGGEMFGGLS
ncbi:MAG: hypothetical protein LQ352_001453 [Teloschistes flavicans]|nr:MAG: hypothetical protein LQ352_001453 [Teloschistes flavicans]